MTIIKLVLNSNPIYALSVRILPVGVRNSLNSLMGRFIWGGSKSSRKLHLVDWDSVTFLFVKGGLGIFRLEDLNSAIIVK